MICWDALLMDTIGAAVRKKRKALGLTLDDIAVFTGISKRTLIKLEAGKDVRFSTLTTVLSAVGLRLDFSEKSKKKLQMIENGQTEEDDAVWF